MRRRRFLIMRMLILCLLVIRKMDQKVVAKLLEFSPNVINMFLGARRKPMLRWR